MNLQQFIKKLKIDFGLRTLPMKKPVPDRDDLYSWLYYHMVLDDSVFPDERQRLQHSTGILMGAFFGSRLCSVFDTRVKFDLPNVDNLSLGDHKVVRDHSASSQLRDDNSINVVSGRISKKPKIIHNNNDDCCSDTKTAYDSEADCYSDTACDNESDSDSDSNSLYDLSDNSDTDDECTAGPEETWSFLY